MSRNENKEGLPDLWQTSQLRMESVLEKVGLDLDFEKWWRRGSRTRYREGPGEKLGSQEPR